MFQINTKADHARSSNKNSPQQKTGETPVATSRFILSVNPTHLSGIRARTRCSDGVSGLVDLPK